MSEERKKLTLNPLHITTATAVIIALGAFGGGIELLTQIKNQ